MSQRDAAVSQRPAPRPAGRVRRLALVALPAVALLLAGCGPAGSGALPSAALTPTAGQAGSSPALPLAAQDSSPGPTSASAGPAASSAGPAASSASPTMTPPPTRSVTPSPATASRAVTASHAVASSALPAGPALPGGTPTTEPPTSKTGPLAGKLIVIDPGHNGTAAEHLSEINQLVNAGGFMKACQTTGTATNAGYPEHAFTWDTALRLAALLRSQGATVVLTRSNDDGWGPCIDQRGLTAARNHATLLISLHGDGAPGSAHGFHVIWPGPVPGYTEASSAPSGRAAVALRDAMVRSGFTPATYVNGGTGLNERTDLGTLNRAGTPALMVECGNMRNAGDAAMMSSPSGRQHLATGLAAGVLAAVAALR